MKLRNSATAIVAGAAHAGLQIGTAAWSPDPLALSRVIPRLATIDAVGLSEASWERLERKGDTPPRIQLSARRVGYRLQDVIAWIQARSSIGSLVKNRENQEDQDLG